MILTFRRCALVLAALSWCSPDGAGADDAEARRRSWQCLPDETVLACRIPDGQAVADALRADTKLGKVLLSEQRLEAVRRLLMEQDPEQWAVFRDGLEGYGLTPQDLPRMLAGESGFALLLERRPAEPAESALFVGLAWLEPGAELAPRALDAIAKAIADHEEDEHPVRRLDIEVEGRPVMHLTLPMVTTRFDAQPFELPEDFGEMDDEQQQEVLEEARRPRQLKQTVTYTHLLLTRLGGRLLLANTFQGTAEPDAERAERLTGVLARFLRAHGSDEPGFTVRLGAAEGVAGALPAEGLTALELLADPAPLVALAAERPGGAATVKVLGLSGLGPVAMRSTLAGSALRSGLFVGAAAPRAGVLALLDQPALASEPPAWVPADLVGYSHLSADLGAIYTQVRRMLLEAIGPQVEPQIQMVEGQVLATTESDLPTVLSSLGHRHAMLTFEPDVAGGAAAAAWVGVDLGRMAAVWQLKDEALWARMMAVIGGFAPMTGGALQPAQEQGYTGWRFAQEPVEGGLVTGNGHMVLGMGAGVLERVLASLGGPPAGEHALRGSPLFARARAMLDLEPGIGFQLLDGARYAKMVRHALDQMLRQAAEAAAVGLAPQVGDAEDPEDEAADPDEPDDGGAEAGRTTAQRWRELLPTDAEVEGMLGPAVGYARMADAGLVVKSVNELPPP